MCRQSILCSSPFCSLLKDLEGTKLLYGSSPPSQSTKLAGFFSRRGWLTAIRNTGIPLGKRREIALRKLCPFCRLAAFAISNSPQRLEWDDGRRISVVWDESKEAFNLVCDLPAGSAASRSLPLGERIRFCTNSKYDSSRNGRGVDPDHIHVNVIKHWISTCNQYHTQSCLSVNPGIVDLQRSSDRLLLIDVQNNCIVQKPWSVRYLALSYIWGRTQQLNLSKANYSDLTQRDALLRHQGQISRTIQDSMHFVKSIGQRYLWADTLCLVQDDAQHIGRGVEIMGLIYDGAYLTIIAANGSSADAGLLRVHNGSQGSSQHVVEIFPGLKMTVVRAVDTYLRKSTWASRGWTYAASFRILTKC